MRAFQIAAAVLALLVPVLIFGHKAHAEEEVTAGQVNALEAESMMPKGYSYAGFIQSVDFNSLAASGTQSPNQHFSETYAYNEIALPNKDAITILGEYDINYLDHTQDEFWNTEVRYNFHAIKLAENADWKLETKLNTGVDLPTSYQWVQATGMQAGAIAQGNLLLSAQNGKIRQTYKVDLEAYHYFNSEADSYNSGSGSYNGPANFAWEYHEKATALFEYRKFWIKLELKHYDFTDYNQGGTALFRHWESVGYHFTKTFGVETGQAYRGDLVGQARYGNDLSFIDSERSLFFASLIVSL